MILLVLGWQPLLVGRAWKSFSSQPMVTDDIDGLIGPITENIILVVCSVYIMMVN